MLFGNPKHHRILAAIAMICLAIAFALRSFVHPSAAIALYLTNAFQGLLIGLALAFSLRAATTRISRMPNAKLHRPTLPAAIIAIGMLLLAVAVGSLKFLRPSAHFGPDLVDEVHGVLFGVSIGTTLLGVALAALRLRGCLVQHAIVRESPKG